jgi:Pyruvate/2-oxoacid:ferredoxin oxidoreductase gamma subunit
MKFTIGFGSVIGISATGLVLAVAGAGAAHAAPDVVGQTYSDAASAIEGGGGTVNVAVTVGSRLPRDECIVTNAWSVRQLVPQTSDTYFEYTQGVTQVALNCDGDHATADHPGASVASPEGREAKAAADQAAEAERQGIAEASTPGE